MIKLIKRPLLIIFIIISIIIGYFIGYDLSYDFSNLYLAKFTYESTLYILIILLIYNNSFIYKYLNRYSILFRKNTFLKYNIYIVFLEFILSMVIMLCINASILLLNFQSFMQNIISIIILNINIISISLLIMSIIKLFDIKIKNILISSSIFIILLVFFHVILEYFNASFDFRHIFILPFIYKYYYSFIFIFFIFEIIFFNLLNTYLEIKRDYFLRRNQYEEN